MLGNHDGYARAKDTSIFLGHCEGEFLFASYSVVSKGYKNWSKVSVPEIIISAWMPDSTKLPPHLEICDVDDGVVPAGLAKASAAAFQGVGFQDVTLKTYPKWVNQQLLSVAFVYKALWTYNSFIKQLFLMDSWICQCYAGVGMQPLGKKLRTSGNGLTQNCSWRDRRELGRITTSFNHPALHCNRSSRTASSTVSGISLLQSFHQWAVFPWVHRKIN